MSRALCLAFLILCASCMPEAQNKHLVYQNIVILSDLSSRTTNIRFPQKDFKEIQRIVHYFKTECVKPGEKIGDKSSISFNTFSNNPKIEINLEKFKDLATKQSFINSTGKFKNDGLDAKLAQFEQSVRSSYENISNPGLDLISLLIEKIENDNFVKHDEVITNGIDTTFIKYENHLYVFTDGYLEYASREKQRNNQFYFGDKEIERIRQFCKINNLDIATALKENKSLALPTSNTAENKRIVLHIVETHERDKDTKYQTYKHSKGLRDNEILEAVWKKWARDSGFKDIIWRKY